MIIPVNGVFPKIHQSAWVAPGASIIGDVEIGAQSSIWYNVVIRGDVFAMRIGREVNMQDGSVLHGTYKKCGVTLHDSVTVGHMVMLHGCTIGENSLIGMGSIVMDNAFIPENCLVGAGSLVTEDSHFEPGSLILGRPAKAKRKLTAEEIKAVSESADHYVMYTGWYAGQGGKIP